MTSVALPAMIGAAEIARPLGGELDGELVLDDVDDLVDDEAHRAVAVGEDQDGLAAFVADDRSSDRSGPAASACRDTARPACRSTARSCRARSPRGGRPAPAARPSARRRRRGTAAGWCARRPCRRVRRRLLAGLRSPRRAISPLAAAMPLGSRIMMTLPSPRMVLPENIVMSRRIGATGLTTISSVSKTRSTMMPKL